MGANNGPSVPSIAAPLYRIRSDGYDLEVFDERVVLVERRVGADGRLSGEVERLAELRNQGVLSEDEFAAAKRRVIGST